MIIGVQGNELYSTIEDGMALRRGYFWLDKYSYNIAR